jgi:hypothetical protein
VWSGSEKPTAGCTALSRGDLLELLRWLEPSKQPLLVQLPETLFPRMNDAPILTVR